MRIFSLKKLLTSICLCLMLLVVGSSVQAAALTALSDRMSRQDASQTSDHEIRFTTPAGVDANTDTITLTFPPGFNLTTLTFGDLDLSHGAVTGFETNETIAASASAGVWGATISSQVITFTAPTDAAAGEITAGDKVIVRIGLNATGGVNRITNPSTGNSYTLSLAGTFGDTGTITVPIISAGTISVSATVGTQGGGGGGSGGGGGGNGGQDGQPPQLLNIQVINITANSADVVWDTDEPADSRVNYGLTNGYGAVSSSNVLTFSHLIHLDNLVANTLYHLQVSSKDAIGNPSSSGDIAFTTVSTNVGPIISNVRVINITNNSATIAWDTNVAATTFVQYGLTSAYGQSASVAGTRTNHQVDLINLTLNTLYHFSVQSTDGNGRTSISQDFNFTTTPDTTPPSNVFGFTALDALRSVNLLWSNPSESDFSFVRIVARTDRFPNNPNDGRLVYEGAGTNTTDSSLQPNVRVFYAAYAFDFAGNNSSGALDDATPFDNVIIPPTTTSTTSTPPTPPVTPPTGTSSTPPTPPGSGTSSTPPTTTVPVTPPAGTTTTEPIAPPTGTTTIEEIPPLPTPTTPRINPQYFASQGKVALDIDDRGTINALINQPVLVKVPVSSFSQAPTRGTIRIGQSTYALTPLPGEAGVWGASFVPGKTSSTMPVYIDLTFPDDSHGTQTNQINIQNLHRVFEGTGTEAKGLPNIEVQVFRLENGKEVAYNITASSNRLLTDKNGFYGVIVPNGLYRLKIQQEGYDSVTRDITVTQNILSRDIELTKSFNLGALIDVIRTPEVKQAANIAAPVALIATIGAAASAVSLFSLLNYLYLLLSQPFLLIKRRKREQWGTVYNSLSKLPIELAAVRLIDAITKRVVQTRVTDAKGRYTFFVKPGKYFIDVTKPGYKSPSELMKGETVDIDYVDLYFGNPIEVKEETSLGVNIPVDPIVPEETPRKVLLKRFFRRAQNVIGVLSMIITIIALILSPSWWLAGMAAFQIVTYLLFRRLALPVKPKQWGIIRDASGKKKKLDVVIVRIFDKKFNKLLDTQITDRSGRYGFIVGKNQYFVTAVKDGYDTYKSQDLDYSNQPQGVVNQPIDLKKKMPGKAA